MNTVEPLKGRDRGSFHHYYNRCFLKVRRRCTLGEEKRIEEKREEKHLSILPSLRSIDTPSSPPSSPSIPTALFPSSFLPYSPSEISTQFVTLSASFRRRSEWAESQLSLLTID